MADLKQIRQSAVYTDKWLKGKQALHVQMVENSILNLQNEILESLNTLQTTGGNLAGVAVNMKQARAVHKDIVKSFDKNFTTGTKKIINDFNSTTKVIDKSLGILDESAKFTGVDNTMMDVLKDGYYQEYLNLGETYKNQVTQAMYNQVIGGGSFLQLQNTISAALMGSNAKDALGRSMAMYSRLYARDMIMNFHNEMNLKKAEDIGMKHFLYYGTVIASSRSFCRRRVGKTYSKDQINSWKYKWPGKSGPAMTHRGGYNCRHHWQPVRKKWVEDYDQIEMQDYFKETGRKVDPKIKPTDQKPKPKPEPKPVPKPKPIPKPKAPTMPVYKDVNAHVEEWDRGPGKAKQKEIATARVAYDKADADYKNAFQAYSTAKAEGKSESVMKAMNDAVRATGNRVCDAKMYWMALRKDYKQAQAKLINDFIRPTQNSVPDLKLYYGASKVKATQKKQIANLAKMADEVGLMFDKKVTDKIPTQYIEYKARQRAYHRHNSHQIGIGSLTDTKTLVHEFSHAVERNYPGAKKAAFAFRNRRVGNEAISTIYKGTTERGWKDEFFSHYCGKDYGSMATEIISMGVERMYKEPLVFMRKDPDYFEFILKIMWGEV